MSATVFTMNMLLFLSNFLLFVACVTGRESSSSSEFDRSYTKARQNNALNVLRRCYKQKLPMCQEQGWAEYRGWQMVVAGRFICNECLQHAQCYSGGSGTTHEQCCWAGWNQVNCEQYSAKNDVIEKIEAAESLESEEEVITPTLVTERLTPVTEIPTPVTSTPDSTTVSESPHTRAFEIAEEVINDINRNAISLLDQQATGFSVHDVNKNQTESVEEQEERQAVVKSLLSEFLLGSETAIPEDVTVLNNARALLQPQPRVVNSDQLLADLVPAGRVITSDKLIAEQQIIPQQYQYIQSQPIHQRIPNLSLPRVEYSAPIETVNPRAFGSPVEISRPPITSFPLLYPTYGPSPVFVGAGAGGPPIDQFSAPLHILDAYNNQGTPAKSPSASTSVSNSNDSSEASQSTPQGPGPLFSAGASPYLSQFQNFPQTQFNPQNAQILPSQNGGLPNMWLQYLQNVQRVLRGEQSGTSNYYQHLSPENLFSNTNSETPNYYSKQTPS